MSMTYDMFVLRNFLWTEINYIFVSFPLSLFCILQVGGTDQST